MRNNDTMMRFFERVYLDAFGIQYDEFTLNFYVYFDNYGKFSCSKYDVEFDLEERVYFDDIDFRAFFHGDDIEIQKHFYKNNSQLEYVDVIMKNSDVIIRFDDDKNFYIYSYQQMKLFDIFLKVLNLRSKSIVQNGIASFYVKGDDNKTLYISLFSKNWYAYNGRKKLTHEEIRQLLKLAFVQEPIIKVYKVKNRKTKFNKITVDLPDVRLILLPDGTLSVQLDNLDMLEGQAVIEDYINVKE